MPRISLYLLSGRSQIMLLFKSRTSLIEKITHGISHLLVINCVASDDLECISTIPLNRSQIRDEIIWHFDNTGIFSMKSAYHFTIFPYGRPILVVAHHLWSKLWGLSTPQKIKHSIWCAYDNAVPTRVNLKKRNVDIDDICPLCNSDQETTYCFLFCDTPNKVWFASDLSLRIFNALNFGFADWFMNWFKLKKIFFSC